MTPTLATRVLEPELMDDPGLDRDAHDAALRGLARINRWSGAARTIWSAIDRRLPGRRTLRVVDLACGSADVSLAVVQRARRRGVDIDLTGYDISPVATDAARARAAATGIDARFVTAGVDGFRDTRTPEDASDVVMCSLFLHHLTEDAAVKLLRTMRDGASEMVLVDDLRRGRWGALLAAIAPRLLTRSSVVHADARLSVRAAFTTSEATQMAASAGLREVAIQPHWPGRFLLTAAGGSP